MDVVLAHVARRRCEMENSLPLSHDIQNLVLLFSPQSIHLSIYPSIPIVYMYNPSFCVVLFDSPSRNSIQCNTLFHFFFYYFFFFIFFFFSFLFSPYSRFSPHSTDSCDSSPSAFPLFLTWSHGFLPFVRLSIYGSVYWKELISSPLLGAGIWSRQRESDDV